MSIYGLIIGFCAVIYIVYIDKLVIIDSNYAKKHIYSYYFYYFLPFILGIIFARIIPILEEVIKSMSNNGTLNNISLSEIFSFHMQGLSFFGAIIGGIIGLTILTRVFGLKLSKLFDHTFYILPILQCIGRIGNFINKELYGIPTNLPWGIYIPIENRSSEYINFEYYHPTFAYEMILNAIFFIIITLINKKFNLFKKPLLITSIYLIYYGIIRILLNRIRIVVGSSDIFAFSSIIIGIIILIIINLNKSSKSNIIWS